MTTSAVTTISLSRMATRFRIATLRNHHSRNRVLHWTSGAVRLYAVWQSSPASEDGQDVSDHGSLARVLFCTDPSTLRGLVRKRADKVCCGRTQNSRSFRGIARVSSFVGLVHLIREPENGHLHQRHQNDGRSLPASARRHLLRRATAHESDPQNGRYGDQCGPEGRFEVAGDRYQEPDRTPRP
jgi:hypothetical protein